MRWRAKSQLLALASKLPGGPWLYRRLPARLLLARLRPLSDFAKIKARAAQILRDQGPVASPPKVFEFGAGRDLAWALAFIAAGAGEVTTVDISRLARLSLVRRAAKEILPAASSLKHLGDLKHSALAYLAPADARKTQLAEDSIDVVFSTDVLEHVPAQDILAILLEMRRILRPGGSIVAQINYADHFSYGDPSIGPRNFLHFSEDAWQRHNSDLHFQNRLRHSQHLALWRQAGFHPEVKAIGRLEMSEAERKQLAPAFAVMDNDDLEILGATLVAVKKD